MKIIEISATQIRIFKEDTIPYHILLKPDKIKNLVERLAFQSHEIPFPISDVNAPRILNLRAGEVKINQKSIFIYYLNFENRKVVAKIKGTTHDAITAFEEISSILCEIIDGLSLHFSNVILKSDETECVAQLDIDYYSLFSPKLKKFLKTNLMSKLSEKAESVVPKQFSFEIRFFQPQKYSKYNITLSRKIFTLEPRPNTSLEDRIFYTKSPCPSETHLELLKEIEEIFKA